MPGIKTSNVVWTTPFPMGAGAYIIPSDAPASLRSWGSVLRDQGFPVWVCDGVNDQVEYNAAISAGYRDIFIEVGSLYGVGFNLVSDLRVRGTPQTTSGIYLSNSANADLFASPVDAVYNNIWLEGLSLHGNRANNSSGSGIYGRFSGLHVNNCLIDGFAEDCIKLHASSTAVFFFTNTRLTNFSNRGLNILGGDDVYACNLDIGDTTQAGLNGIYMGGKAGLYNNIQVFGCAQSAIVIADREQQLNNITLGGTIGQHGIYIDTSVKNASLWSIQITGLRAWDISTGSTGAYSVVAANTNGAYTIQTLKVAYGDYVGYTYNAEYFLKSMGTWNLGGGCSLSHCGAITPGNLGSGLRTADIIATDSNYIGITVSENKGSATLLNGSTSVVFSHTLLSTPTHVDISWKENPSNAIGDWWWTADGATVTLNGVDPGASNLDFSWEAKV